MMSDEEQQRHETKVCIECSKKCTKKQFAKRQWKREQPLCRLCAEVEQQQTKACIQCSKNCTKDQFPTKQWKREQPSCRLCAEFTNISEEKTRPCHQCKAVLPSIQFDIYQWGKGAKALCHCCREVVGKNIIDSIGTSKVKDLPDGTAVCFAHSLERCDICMMDFTLPNQFARKRKALGRDLTDDESTEQINASLADVHISRKICIMDGQSMCPRSGRKLRCPCDEVTYCSQACQKHHWVIHKMTCKVFKTKKEKTAKKNSKSKAAPIAAQPAHGLTEEQLDFIHIEAFMAENNGGEHSIEECAWQLGEHPLIIGGGSIRMGANKREFIKGDVAKIYMEGMGEIWDGSPRFGMGDYVQQKTPEDWIARARRGKSQRENVPTRANHVQSIVDQVSLAFD
mmetsp:Transcript_14763/g.32075  ORF Transcript_14763/g.32075 Transcript_14763/m.32075 type:complete len:398 (-) Transcript_14763:157-1350(-)